MCWFSPLSEMRPLGLLIVLWMFGLAGTGMAQEPNAVTGLSYSNSGLTLTLNTRAEHLYRIESSSTLQPPWQVETEIDATGGVVQWTDTKVTDTSQRYYRVAVTPPNVSTTTLTQGVAMSVDILPTELIVASGTSRQFGADGAFLASQLGASGLRLVTTGTLTQQGNLWSYAPEPTDRLHVFFQDKSTADYYVTEMVGDFSFNAAHFLNNNHVFKWRSVSEQYGDLTFSSTRNGRLTEVTVVGTYNFRGTSYMLDLTSLVDHFFEGGGSAHTITDTGVTGTIRAENYHQTVAYRQRFEIISNTNVSASTNEVWLNSQLTLGGTQYVWKDVKTQKSFLSGKVSQLDSYWAANGSITRDGAPIGTYRFKFEAPTVALGYAKFVVVTADGEIELESWPVRPGEGG